MPVVASYTDVGPKSVPREIRQMRRNNLDFHTKLGQPVIIKRRYTLQDETDGITSRCPYHGDTQYDSTMSNCPYCFGTGFLGGYADGVITFVSLGDTPTDLWRLTDAGLLQRMEHPQATSPWFPYIHDGDLIIVANFDTNDWTVLETGDRYVADVVTPVRPRGAAPMGFATRQERGKLNFLKNNDMIVSHSFEIDRLPEGHIAYDVPLDDDAVIYPPVDPDVPVPGQDPDDGPHVAQTIALAHVFKIVGQGSAPGSEADVDVDVIFPEEYS